MLPRLKALRKSASLSQQALATAMGISQQSINKYENQTIEPDLDMLKKLASYFDTTVDYLIGYSDDPVRRNFIPKEQIATAEDLIFYNDYRMLDPSEKKALQLLAHPLATAAQPLIAVKCDSTRVDNAQK